MAEATEAVSKTKSKTEVTEVLMEDGRKVGFPGKRRVMKEHIIDDSKIALDGDTLMIQPGAVVIQIDLRNGMTRKFPLPLSLLTRFAGHGGEQKYGDELASPADKPLSEEDMAEALDSLDERIQLGAWTIEREGGGFSGASDVLKAILEAKQESAPDYTMKKVKAGLQSILDADAKKAETEGRKPITRQALYASFKNPTTKVGKIVKRLEEERASRATSAVNVEDALDSMPA